MLKCQNGGFVDLYRALFRDVTVYDQTLSVDMERDLSRIISNIEARGLQTILKDLPEIGKFLELCLDQGFLSTSNLPLLGRVNRRSPIPRLFKGLWLKLFDMNGCLKQNIDPMYVFFMEQICNMAKKYEVEAPSNTLYEATKEFYDVDSALPPPSQKWDGGSRTLDSDLSISIRDRFIDQTDSTSLFGSTNSDHTQLLDTIQRVADIVSTNLGFYQPEFGSRHGTGAVAENLRGVGKYQFPNLNSRLDATFPVNGFFNRLSEDEPSHLSDHESCSVLLAVPKTIKGPRLIAKEPTAYMYAQLSVMDWLYDRVPHTYAGQFIDFRDQSLSGQMALNASSTGKLATIDLKSASDRISLWLVERLFRRNKSLLFAFADCRTQYVDLSIDKKLPTLHKLRKFSTQGSALTFPVQSIIFLMIVLGTAMYNDGVKPSGRNIRKYRGKVRVFGDDLIVPTDLFGSVVTSLELLFLKVNTQKSFSRGLFRESCGVRAFDGVDITPSYVRVIADKSTEPAAVPGIIDACNNFAKKWLFNLSNALETTIPNKYRKYIPIGSPVAGTVSLHSFSSSDHPHLRKRWNEHLQREEIYALVQRTKKQRFKASGSLLLEAFLAVTRDRGTPSYEGIPDWYPVSRWETRPVVGAGWVNHKPL